MMPCAVLLRTSTQLQCNANMNDNNNNNNITIDSKDHVMVLAGCMAAGDGATHAAAC